MPQSHLATQSITTSYAPLPSVDGHEVSILNTSGQTIDICHTDDDTKAIALPDTKSVMLRCERKASFFSVKGASASGSIQIVVD